MNLNRETILWFYTITIKIAILKAEFKLTLLHTNDMHSRIQETSRTTSKCTPDGPCYGGFARLAYQVKQIKEKTPNTLFLNAGDTYQGTPMYSLFKWHPFPRLMEMLKIDAMSLGNHEFDDGVAGLVPYLKDVKIPVVTCNLNTNDEPSLTKNLKPWHMLTVNNVNISVIGYLTPDTEFLSSTGNVQFLDEIKMIKKYAKKAKQAGAKLIFAVGHSGFLKDQEIAAKVPLVDVVVGGHTDTFLYKGKQPDIEKPVAEYPKMIVQKSGKKVPVVQAYGYTKYLGKLDLVWDDNFNLKSATGNPILLNSSVLKDPDVEKGTSDWIEKLQGTLEQRKGATRVFLDGKCRLKECNFGNLITDAITDFVVRHSVSGDTWWTEGPITFINGGSIRTSINATDNVTWGDLLTTLPFDKQIVRLNMKGSTVMKILERSVERYDVTRNVAYGEFLQVSGLKVRYMQNKTGHLVLEKAMTRCANCTVPRYSVLNPDKDYLVLTTLFVANGGDGYTMLKDVKKEHIYDEADLNILAQYLEKTSPVYPGEEGRIFVPKVLKPLKGKSKS